MIQINRQGDIVQKLNGTKWFSSQNSNGLSEPGPLESGER
jgi:hypothetical protein